MSLGFGVGIGRYLVMGFLDSTVTAIALSPFLPLRSGEASVGSALIIMFINLVTAFMAEYTEERRDLGKMERSLFMRQGSILKTRLYKERIIEVIHRSAVFGAVSFGAAIVTELTADLVKVMGIPVIPIALLGIFGSLMSRYFGGNEFIWFAFYLAIGIAAAGLGLLFHFFLL